MKAKRQRIEGTMYRQMQFRVEGIIDEDERTVQVSISSELPVLRRSFFSDPWIETLGHKKSEVNLERLKNGASVHYNHSRTRQDRIGVVESVKLSGNQKEGRRLEGVVRISKREDVDDIWTDVKDGVLRNISVGYTIDERKLTRDASGTGEPDEFRITSWTPMEVSFVDIPADPSVGVGRNDNGELEYRILEIGSIGEMKQVTVKKVVADDDGGFAAGVAAERTRVADINAIFAPPFATAHAAVRDACIADGNCDIEAARGQLLLALGKDTRPAQTRDAIRSGEFSPGARISMPERGDDFQQAACDALVIRANHRIEKAHPGAQDLLGVSLHDLARMSLGRIGVNTAGLSKLQILTRALTTSDLPLILGNFLNKSTLIGYDEAPATHRAITRETFTPDFKTFSRVAASEVPNLDLVTQEGEFTYGIVSETGSTGALATYGKLIALSRQTIINDDLSEISRALRSMGTGAVRLEANIVWGLLVSNPVMQDTKTLFHADHNNIATAAALSVASLGEMRKLLRLQTGIAGVALLDLQPYALIVPAALETVAEQLLASLADPSGANPQTHNPFFNKLRLVVEPRLDADSSTRYYLATDPNVFSWFDRVYLEGHPQPFLANQDGWSIDGTEFKVRHDFAALINDFRGIVKSDGGA